ncbi:MAG: TIM barrel protein [Allomuricauda sp.]|jgi:inosose dehydratase
MSNTNEFSRRDFIKKSSVAGLAAVTLPNMDFINSLEINEKFQVGATFILWGYNLKNLETSLEEMSRLGFHSFETFGWTIQELEDSGVRLEELIEKHNIPIRSAFCMTDVLDPSPSKRKEEIEKLTSWTKLLKRAGGTLVEYCPASVDRKDFVFKEHRKNMVDAMNDYAKVVTDLGLTCALHPHTGTPVETEEEVYFIMENVDTNYMKFGPDSGQLEKGGADTVKIFRDFMPLIEHVHLKDYEGGDNGYLGYAPLGEGHVKIKKLMKMLERGRDKMVGDIMFELDYDRKIKPAYSTFEAAKISRDYLVDLGYSFT